MLTAALLHLPPQRQFHPPDAPLEIDDGGCGKVRRRARYRGGIRRVTLLRELARVRPDVADAGAVIAGGRVLVDGAPVTNPRSLVTPGCSIVIRDDELRGSAKLRAAIDLFGVDVAGRVALDVGASTGGFTSVLLERGAAKVYAVDAGHDQLLASLRQDARVVDLERTNVGDLDRSLVPDVVEVVTIDVSYLPLREAVGQLDRIAVAPGAELIGLVKPMFELKLAEAPTTLEAVDQACASAAAGIVAAGWRVEATARSPVTGARGATEGFLHARIS